MTWISSGTVNWFPGHMVKAIRLIRENLKNVDIVLEIRDARIPFSSENYKLNDLLKETNKKKLIIFNKADLADSSQQETVLSYYEKKNQPALFICTKKMKSVQLIIPAAIEMAKTLPNKTTTRPITLMTVGFPNVGKSSIINSLKKESKKNTKKKQIIFSKSSKRKEKQNSNLAKVGPVPGVTRHISGFQVSNDPVCFLVDTPGIMVPNIEFEELGLKLAVTGAINDKIIPDQRKCEYILYLLKKYKPKNYIENLGFNFEKELKNISILNILESYSKKKGIRKLKENKFDLNLSKKKFLENFRNGEFGNFSIENLTEFQDSVKQQELLKNRENIGSDIDGGSENLDSFENQ